jgi:hypothetical protein
VTDVDQLFDRQLAPSAGLHHGGTEHERARAQEADGDNKQAFH